MELSQKVLVSPFIVWTYNTIPPISVAELLVVEPPINVTEISFQKKSFHSVDGLAEASLDFQRKCAGLDPLYS